MTILTCFFIIKIFSIHAINKFFTKTTKTTKTNQTNNFKNQIIYSKLNETKLIEFKSYFPTYNSQKNRIFNLKKICKTINNTTLKPGDVFSFEKLYELSQANGKFKYAEGIENGEFTSVYGGGICQVATAIFQAANLANLEIIERHKHSKPVFYGKNGDDAMFNSGSADFKFKNNQQFAIKINSKIVKNYVEIILIKLYNNNI